MLDLVVITIKILKSKAYSAIAIFLIFYVIYLSYREFQRRDSEGTFFSF